MTARKALIVDDSKSARAFLTRVLEKYDVNVDTAENAEQALEYLTNVRPDVIFMDHLMPGMDGFQALQSIKNNPRTAMIPIMMYTSQEGELYLGQARALGAIGVLPKQIKPADVSRVLYQLRILPERRGNEEQTTFSPGNVSAQAAARGAAREAGEGPHLRVVSSNPGGPSTTDLRALVESIVQQHMADLHSSVAASLDAQSERLLGDVRVAVQDAVTEARLEPTTGNGFAPPAPRRRVSWAWGLATAAALAAAALGALWWRETAENRDLSASLLASRQESAALVSRLNAALQRERAIAAAPAVAVTGVGASEIALRVPYGEPPLAGERFEALRARLLELQSQDYRGTLQVIWHTGRFCLQKNAAETLELAPESVLLAKCDVVGNPYDESLSPAQREPLAFANLAGSVRQQTSGALRLQLQIGPSNVLAQAYPAAAPTVTAGEWNRAAEANNRLILKLQPAE
jgi:CheY-like chemotaxis protein